VADLVWRLTADGALACGDVLLGPRKPEQRIVRSPADPEDRFVLRDWTEYKLKGPGLRSVRLGDIPVDPVDDGIFLFSYENAVGLSRIFVRAKDGDLPPLPVEVVSRKLVLEDPTHPLYQPRFLLSLIEGIAEHLADSAFDVRAPTVHRVEESSAAATDIFRFHFLLRHARELCAGVRGVLGNPHRVLQRREEVAPAARVRRVDATGLMWSLSQGLWAEVAEGGVWAARDGRSYAPATLHRDFPEASADFLTQALAWATGLRGPDRSQPS